MPCMSCGDDDRDYCEACFSRARTIIQELLDAAVKAGECRDFTHPRWRDAKAFLDQVASYQEAYDVEDSPPCCQFCGTGSYVMNCVKDPADGYELLCQSCLAQILFSETTDASNPT